MRWERLVNCPLDVRRYRHIVDLAHGRVLTRPLMIGDGLTRPAPYLMTPEDEMIETKDLYKFFIFRTEMVYFHVESPPPWSLCLLAVPAHIAADMNMVAGAAYRLLVPKPIYGVRPVCPADRRIHWLGSVPPSTVLTSWITLNPGWEFHIWSGPGSPTLTPAQEPPTIIQYHDAAATRAVIANWLDERSSERAENIILALWDSNTEANHVLVNAYLRGGMLLAAVGGGFYVGGNSNEVTCLRPLEPMLDIHAGAYMGSADWFTYAAGDNEDWQDTVTYYVESVLAPAAALPPALPPAPFVVTAERQVCLFSPVGPLMLVQPEPEPEPTHSDLTPAPAPSKPPKFDRRRRPNRRKP